MGWAEQEFETLDLGDARLDRRAVLLADRLGQKPGASIPGACENWSETTAAYRFLRNQDVNWDDVMSAHWDASQKRMAEHKVVLCLQDTTELDYNGQEMEGLCAPVQSCAMYKELMLRSRPLIGFTDEKS